IERSEVQRVGSETFFRFNVRILAATRRDLDREAHFGRFRDDLFFRLAVARIELPPLRARRGDVELLANHFWRQLGGTGLAPAVLLERFVDYKWPGNVRELYNAVARHRAIGDLFPLELEGPDASGLSERAQPRDFVAEVLALNLPLAPS